jgi:hypothetical protein
MDHVGSPVPSRHGWYTEQAHRAIAEWFRSAKVYAGTNPTGREIRFGKTYKSERAAQAKLGKNPKRMESKSILLECRYNVRRPPDKRQNTQRPCGWTLVRRCRGHVLVGGKILAVHWHRRHGNVLSNRICWLVTWSGHIDRSSMDH